MPMATKLGRMVTYFEGLLTIKSFNALITWSNEKHYISTIRVSMATLCRIVIYFDGSLPIKSHDPFISWSLNIT